MTDIEIMQRAKLYIDKLANGVNPITDKPVSDEDCINNVRITRCLFYVSDVLRKVIENGGISESKEEKAPFYISQEQLSHYSISEKPISMSEMASRINDLADSTSMKKIRYSAFANYLINNGFLKEVEGEDGKTSKEPTEKGFEVGIIREERIGRTGRQYHVNLLTHKAQKFLIDNMSFIVDVSK